MTGAQGDRAQGPHMEATVRGYQALKDALSRALDHLAESYVAVLAGDRQRAERAINQATEQVERAEDAI